MKAGCREMWNKQSVMAWLVWTVAQTRVWMNRMSNSNAVKWTIAQQDLRAAAEQDRHFWDKGTGSYRGAQLKHKAMLHCCNTTRKWHGTQKAAGQPTQEETANGKGAIFTTGAKLMCSDLTSWLGSSPSLRKCAHPSTKRYKTAGKTEIIWLIKWIINKKSSWKTTHWEWNTKWAFRWENKSAESWQSNNGKKEITDGGDMKTVAIQNGISCIERRWWREMCLKKSIILSRCTATNQNTES